MQQPIVINESAPGTAGEEALIAALVQALKDVPGVVISIAPDVQSTPTATAA